MVVVVVVCVCVCVVGVRATCCCMGLRCRAHHSRAPAVCAPTQTRCATATARSPHHFAAEGIFAKVEDILYFSHKLIKHMTDLSTGRHAAKTKNALDFRVGKKILKNFANNNKLAAGTEQSIIDLSAAVRAKHVPRLGPCTHDMTAPTFVLRPCVYGQCVCYV